MQEEGEGVLIIGPGLRHRTLLQYLGVKWITGPCALTHLQHKLLCQGHHEPS